MRAHTDKIIHWLLSSLEPVSSIFHVGQYCGDGWRASTAGRARASFHVVLHGGCWLHVFDGRASVPLAEGDAVFLMRDLPHALTSAATPPARTRDAAHAAPPAMQRFDPDAPDAVGLACGFLAFRNGSSDWIASYLPDCLVVRRGSAAAGQIHAIVGLIRAEAAKPGSFDEPSPLIARLTELLFFYAVRDAVDDDSLASGLAPLMRRAEFASLIAAVIDRPGDAWTTDAMASFAHMSRATFFKRFVDACGQPPAQFVTLIRMKIAAEMLRQGEAIARVAEWVGYQSESAFAHAFKRTVGLQPGAYRREQGGAPPPGRTAGGPHAAGANAALH
ncbi:AraC family transcriptional regulator [Burkholderia oklahomensis]|uniref:AraC family transcriptional regulator n=1 Tax=Burkholderia oklahomensis TaxID=342113 RepID=UPI0005D8FA64|nr:AraC family transcriptional regulator [Burkholderia oklahomensis]AJX35105.1 helix-turn-helix domain protein [Burkholderia oklahomensis C6786]AOI49602.1 cupin [Burkholderia oklahomensis C6786]KUY59190.1 cupin [Burkholderia oklahomensis C6786]MBI0362112.1 AraC family transcriptional regulator [Burkholderia oklahomensis]SUY29063.1 transcriptional activator FtrA [Burkholderia oklahomensis]